MGFGVGLIHLLGYLLNAAGEPPGLLHRQAMESLLSKPAPAGGGPVHQLVDNLLVAVSRISMKALAGSNSCRHRSRRIRAVGL